MAKATLNELPNQQLTTQNQPPKIPQPRQVRIITPEISNPEQTRQLFTEDVSSDALATATQYIYDVIKSHESIRAGSFLIKLLEKLQTIPAEVSAEDAAERAIDIAEIEELILELATYRTADNSLDNHKFRAEVIAEIGRENTATYPIITLLRDAIKRIRNSNNRSIEPQINTAQQIALLGIAKQIRSQK